MAKSIMVVGTMSSAGKSFIVAALCRIFAQDGYRVAPFKSQNMALNSFITAEGLEMGRAQVMQAEAAKIKPTVHMNPILLKPTSEKGSQVILNGEVYKNMTATEYYQIKTELIPHIQSAYNSLSEAYDIIVIEGAGSPAEINLKSQDIVNMGLAKLVDAPVILVGDIDRGGVFASLAGTMLLLEEEERDRIEGVIINKFRGDIEILRPGLTMLTDIIHKPVLGVVPMLDVIIDDEDSLSDGLTRTAHTGAIDIVVIRLPKISNFTDFTALSILPEVSLRYVSRAQEVGNPDLLILPGTKNTMADLKWLRQTGLEVKILQYAAKGGVVFGICGGYQMLGTMLSDPLDVEEGGEMQGMNLLPITTTFAAQKVRTQVTGSFGAIGGVLAALSGVEIAGYEIHMGHSAGEEICSLTEIRTQTGQNQTRFDGAYVDNVYGSYIHGIFDKEQVVKQLILSLAEKKGIHLSELSAFDLQAFKETQYDKLAASVRSSLDMGKIYAMLSSKTEGEEYAK